MATLFTKIIEGEIPSHRVYEDDRTYAFLDINPRSEGHTLVVPKREVDYLFDLPPEDYRALWDACAVVADALKAATGCARVFVAVAGYEVPHAHVHLVPTDRLEDFPFPPVDTAAQANLDDTAELVRGAFYGPDTALLVVDMQNDFADPDGSLAVDGGTDIIPFVNDEIARASAADATIVYTQDWHPESTPHFEKDGGVWPVHCVGETWGAEFHPELDVVDDAVFIRKGTGGEDGYSAFSLRDPETGEESSTGLQDELDSRGVSRVVVVGLAADYCVKETVLDAVDHGFDTRVLTRGTRAVDLEEGDGDRALQAMDDAGADLA